VNSRVRLHDTATSTWIASGSDPAGPRVLGRASHLSELLRAGDGQTACGARSRAIEGSGSDSAREWIWERVAVTAVSLVRVLYYELLRARLDALEGRTRRSGTWPSSQLAGRIAVGFSSSGVVP
jgi:hypothetical protein